MKTIIVKKHFSIILAGISFSLLFFLSISVSAQPKRDFDHNPDKTLKGDARVNPSTLAMELSVPVGLYPGRAGNATSITFDYSSKVWQQRNFLSFVHPSGNEGTTVVPLFAKRSAAGWTSSLGVPTIDYPQSVECYVGYGQNYNGEIWNGTPSIDLFYLKRLHVTLPDGSSHELRENDTPVNIGQNTCPPWDPVGTYLSVDGSKLRLQIGASSSTLYMPDGSRYVFDGANAHYATAFIDSSGNKATYNTSTKQWTDMVGRVFNNPLPYNEYFQQDQTVGDQNLTLPGMNGSTMNVTFSWRYLKDPNGGESGLENPNQNLAYPAMYYCVGSLYTQVPGTYLFANADYEFRVCNYGASYPGTAFNPIVLTKIKLANGLSYQFKYNLYGEIEKIIFPTGGYERFNYSYVPGVQRSYYTFDQTNRGVVDRWVSEKGDGTDEIHWSYSATRYYDYQPPYPPQAYKVTTNNPDGTRTEQLLHDEPDLDLQRPYGFDSVKTGKAYEDRVFSSGNPAQLLRRTLTKYTQTGPLPGGFEAATRDARPEKQVSIIFEPNNSYALAQLTETVYDTTGNSDAAYFSSLNAKQSKVYKYKVLDLTTAQTASITAIAALFSVSDLETNTESDYLYDANYKARNISGLVTETRIRDAAGNIKGKSQSSYDEGFYLEAASISNATGWENPNTSIRGLATTTRRWFDVGNNLYFETHTLFDQFGNPRKNWDGKGNFSEIQYTDNYTDNINRNTYLMPTKTIAYTGANGTGTMLQTTIKFDFTSGLPRYSIDLNNQVTETQYDTLLRPTLVIQPNGHQTITEYGVPNSSGPQAGQLPVGQRFVKVKSQTDTASWKETYAWFDGVGRTVKSQSVDSGGDVFVDTVYDPMGRVKKVTNPYRVSETIYWSENFYDDLGRVIKVKSPDNAEVNTLFSLATTGSQIGTTVTVTDQALKQRRAVTNALGQVTRIDEPFEVKDINGNVISVTLGTIDAPAQPTYYKYNTLGKMIEVTQSTQKRYFLYDALGRLLRVRQPEQQINSALNMSHSETTNTQWTAGFTYDNNGNIYTATDAKNVTITNAYDALNRPLTRSYSDSTPGVTFTYDASTVPNSIGKLTKVTSTISETRYTYYDIMGRLISSEQETDGRIYSSGFKYNLAGMVTEQTYPSGRVVKAFMESDGDLQAVSSRAANGQFKTYATNFSYMSTGVIKHLQLGNGLWESGKVNTRDQVTELNMGTSPTDASKWQIKFDYGEFDVNGNVDTTKNSGNIAKQTISFSSLAQPFVQTYKYDALNRINEARETNNGNQTWKQTWGYDLYGNRTGFTQNIGGQQMPINNLTLPQIDPNTNRYQTGQGYSYDLNGNLVQDAEGRQFTFNGDNKQTEVRNASSVLVGRYFYDGNGERVKKIEYDQYGAEKEIIIFVHDGTGKLVAEHSTAGPASTPTVNYTATDPLGSPRVVTNKKGEIVSRRDFMPFGEQLMPDATYRTTALKYTTGDNIRQKFTGYQRDEETQLDYAEARYYNFKHGRFTAVDPLLTSGKSANPQTFNRYVYTMNRPLILTDSTGLQSGKKPKDGDDVIKVETQLSKRAPSIKNVEVTSNGKPIRDDLYIGDKFTITYTYIINKPDDPKQAAEAGKVQSADKSKSTGFKDGKSTGETTEAALGTFTDVEGAKKVGETTVKTVGTKDDEVEVTKSETFEITGNPDSRSRGNSNQINFQIVVTDPRAPVTENRNDLQNQQKKPNEPKKKDPQPANPAIFTTRLNDPRKEVESDPNKAISYRNRKRPNKEED